MAATSDTLDKALMVAEKFDLKSNLQTAMTKYFDNLESRNYSECGNLLRTGQLGEKGFLIGSMIQGTLKAYGDGQKYHYRTQLVLANLASEVIKGQTSFQTQLVQLQASYVQLTKEINEHYKTRQEDITKKMMDKQEQLEKIMLDPDSKLSDERIKMYAASIAHTQDKLENVLKAYYSAATKLVEANKIPDGFIEKCMEAQKSIMQSITSSITEIAKQQSSGFKSLVDGAKEIAFKLIDEKAKTQALTFSKEGSSASSSSGAIAAPSSTGGDARVVESEEDRATERKERKIGF